MKRPDNCLEPEPSTVHLEVSHIPLALNRWNRLHWTTQRQYSTDWADRLSDQVIQLPYATRHGLFPFQEARVHLTYLFPKVRERDEDNYSPKQILDALRKTGVLAGDSTEHVRSLWNVLVDRERAPLTVIDIWPGRSGMFFRCFACMWEGWVRPTDPTALFHTAFCPKCDKPVWEGVT